MQYREISYLKVGDPAKVTLDALGAEGGGGLLQHRAKAFRPSACRFA